MRTSVLWMLAFEVLHRLPGWYPNWYGGCWERFCDQVAGRALTYALWQARERAEVPA